MFNTSNGFSLADIAAATGGNRSNDNGWGEGGAWWIIILFLFCFMGWGNNGFAGNGGGASGALTRGELCQDMNFADVQSGIRGISDSVNLGFANLNSTICAQQYDTASMINAMNVSNLQTANAQNIANLQSTNAIQTQLADCCCKTQSAIEGINFNMSQNTCALQNTMNTNTRDIIDATNAGTRAILDQLCQDKIATLTNENQALRLAASQQAQNAYLVEQLGPKVPIAAYQVPNPFIPYGYGYNNCGCGYSAGCGCSL